MLSKRTLWFTLGSWLLTGVSSFETLIDLPYFIRFPVTCLFALVGIVTLALSLPPASKKGRGKGRAAVAITLYGIVNLLMAVLTVLLLHMSLVFHSLTIEEHSCEGAQCIEITPPRKESVNCEIVLPSEVPSRCKPYDPEPEIAHLALVDWNTTSPLLRIVDFRFPEQAGLRCSPSVAVKLLHPGPGVEFLSGHRLKLYDTIRYCFGGALWLIAIYITIGRWKHH